MNNSELLKTKIARANSTKHSEDWGLQFWEEHLETEEAKKLIWNHTPRGINSPQNKNNHISDENPCCIAQSEKTGSADNLLEKAIKPIVANYLITSEMAKQQIEQMFGGKK